MATLKVVLGDFFHTTKMMANNLTPLAIASIAAYCHHLFGQQVEVVLYKSTKQLLSAIEKDPPDVLALSYYMWNASLSHYVMQRYKEIHPEGVAVLGGPNFPREQERVATFLESTPSVDFVIKEEGERPFANIVQEMLGGRSRLDLRKKPPAGCYCLNGDGVLVHQVQPLIKNLDDLPSPYLTGLMDRFLLEQVDGYWLFPLFERTRGCPYLCTFCHASVSKKVRGFSVDRFVSDVEYVAKLAAKHGREIPVVMFADQNLGMYEEDIIIAHKLKKMQEQYGFPERVIITTGKGKPDRVLQTIEAFPAYEMTLSVQSMDKAVLKAIKRENFPLDRFQQYQAQVQEKHGMTVSEIILGLPEDSREKHLATINTLLSSNINVIIPFSYMMLLGTPDETFEARDHYQFGTQWRMLPGGFSKFGGQLLMELEEIVTTTSTMTFEDYVDLRRIHLWTVLVFNGSIFPELRSVLSADGGQFAIFLAKLDALVMTDKQCTPEVVNIMAAYTHKIRNELFVSPEALITHHTENYESLLDNRIGENLLQTYKYYLLKEMADIVEPMITVLTAMFAETSQTDAIEAVCHLMRARGACIGKFLEGSPPTEAAPITFDANFDLCAWQANPVEGFEQYRSPTPLQHTALYSPAILDKWAALAKIYGTSLEGKARIHWRIGVDIVRPVINLKVTN